MTGMRRAARATLIEKHVPSAKIVEANIRSLGVEDFATLLITSAFLWAKRDLASAATIGAIFIRLGLAPTTLMIFMSACQPHELPLSQLRRPP